MTYRQQIAEAFRALLHGHTVAGPRVHTKLDRPLNPDTDPPVVLIYANRAERGPMASGNTLIQRMVEVSIEGAVHGTPDDALDAVDALVDSIEAIIEANPTLGNLVQGARWRRSLTDVNSIGTRTLGVCLLQYDVEMLTPNRLPDWLPDDGFDGVPEVVHTLPDVVGADLFPSHTKPPADCGPDGCAPPAWGGEVKKDGTPV